MTANGNLIRPSTTFADAVKSTPLTGANKVPIASHQPRISVFDRLLFPANQGPASDKGKNPIGQVHQARPKPIGSYLNLEPGAALGQCSAAGNPSAALTSGICSRCLTAGHVREACKSPIRCFACLRGDTSRLIAQATVIGEEMEKGRADTRRWPGSI